MASRSKKTTKKASKKAQRKKAPVKKLASKEAVQKKLKGLEKVLIEVALRIAKRGEGALFVIGHAEYTPLVEQSVASFNVCKNAKLLESLALMDGAVIINREGMMEAYGARIKSRKVLKNFGTRHSAAVSASVGDNIVILVSEEDKKIRILKKGKMIMQIDALQRNVERSVSSAVDLLESIGAGTVGTIGTSILVPTLGLALLPGIIVFGSAYYLGKVMTRRKK